MKKAIILTCLFLCQFAYAQININDLKVDDLTYENIVEIGKVEGTTDHVPHFRELFKNTKVRTFLEFGCGLPTKYFLDNCRKVISVEFVTNKTNPDWIKQCLRLYDNYSNWIPLIYFSNYSFDTNWAPYKYIGSEHMQKAAAYQETTHQNYGLIDDFYLVELNAFIKGLVKYNKIDIALVHPSTILRGDLVQFLFGKVAIIAAHDCRSRMFNVPGDVYGYSRIVVPDDYEEISIRSGAGLIIWIQKKHEKLIKEMQEYAIRANEF